MKTRLVPALGVAYFLAMVFFLTYPGYVPFNKIRPLILGLPFSLFWQVMWICGAVLMLATVFIWDTNVRERRRGPDEAEQPPPRPPIA